MVRALAKKRLIFGFLFVCLAAPASASVILKDDVMVEGESVLLGDLFEGLEENVSKNDVVMEAPLPGKTIKLNGSFLSNLAQKYKLKWSPSSQGVEITISRGGEVLSQESILKSFIALIQTHLGNNNLEITLDQAPPFMTTSELKSLSVVSFDPEFEQQRFKTKLRYVVGGPDDGAFKTISLSGRFLPLEEVPVLVSSKEANQVIQESDVAWKKVRSQTLFGNVVRSKDVLIGKTPVRGLIRAGDLIKVDDLRAPIAVRRDQMITALYRNKRIVVSARVQAMQDGSVGEHIRAQNIASKKMIDVKVVSSDTAEVDSSFVMSSSELGA